LSENVSNSVSFLFALLVLTISVLSEGPDVMFNVVDMDESDDTVEVISSQFFGEKVTIKSIKRGPTPQVTFQRTIDDKCGKAFGCVVADLEEGSDQSINTAADPLQPHPRVIDSGSTVETLIAGDTFSHLLVTSHECSFREENDSKRGFLSNVNFLKKKKGSGNEDDATTTTTTTTRQYGSRQSGAPITDGGSLFAYRVPKGKGKWKTDEWLRTSVATGFKVQGQLNNMINPGAPGFVYTFHARQQDKYGEHKRRPLIAVAGDCADSAYVFRPSRNTDGSDKQDPSASYDLMTEIKCGSTVGSIGVGYGDFCETDPESDYAKLYIPCYENDKILVFGLGSGND